MFYEVLAATQASTASSRVISFLVMFIVPVSYTIKKWIFISVIDDVAVVAE
jgi:hypothetical protein